MVSRPMTRSRSRVVYGPTRRSSYSSAAARATRCAAASRPPPATFVMLDADGSADPAEIPAFVEALMAGADFAKGSRFREGGGSSDITRLRRIGNRGAEWVVNVLFGTSTPTSATATTRSGGTACRR